jgi:hypothetical protein
MPGQGINKAPIGLLDFLGIKNLGQYPNELSPTLAPCFELLEWYLSEYQEAIVASAAFAVVGAYQAYHLVPNNETWAVLAASMNSQAVLAAGQTFDGVVACTRGPNPGIQTALADAHTRVTVGEVAWSGWQGLVFLPPGATLGVQNIAAVALPLTLTVSAAIVRIKR